MDCQPLVHWRRWQRAVEESSKGKRCGGERPWCLREISVVGMGFMGKKKERRKK